MYTPLTEIFRKDLAQVLGVAPFRIEVERNTAGCLEVTLDGVALKDDHLDIWAKHVTKVASQRRKAMN